jgi:hypothetical protein
MNKLYQNDNMLSIGSLLMWMGISLAISIAISFILPFPWSLAAVIGIFLLLDSYLVRKASRRMRSENSVFDSLSSLFNSGGGRMANNPPLKYRCISCGAHTNKYHVQNMA